MDYIESRLTNIASANDLEKEIQTKQDTLVSGTNIKTINGSTVLGSGDIEIPVVNVINNDTDAFLTLQVTINGLTTSYKLTKYQE